jgi:hypothetical protein
VNNNLKEFEEKLSCPNFVYYPLIRRVLPKKTKNELNR